MTDWFEQWFGEEYLEIYPHRDDAEAQTVADLISSRLELAPRSAVLDLACGAGRHARVLGERWRVVGLDLSPALLRVARSEDHGAQLVRADMRVLPFCDGAFDLVVNLFTSFGYFRDDSQHRRVMAEVARTTHRDGWFVLDYLNARHVRSTLVRCDRRLVGSREIEQEREISDDGRFVRKIIRLLDEDRTFVERVRLFEPSELVEMLERCDFNVADVMGGYDGAALGPDSERTIVVGRKR